MTTTPDIDEIELPTDLAHAFREAGDLDECPRTLGQGFDAITDRLNDAEIAVSFTDMYQSTPTRHAVHIGDTVQHVPCVLDALIVAFSLETDPIERRGFLWGTLSLRPLTDPLVGATTVFNTPVESL